MLPVEPKVVTLVPDVPPATTLPRVNKPNAEAIPGFAVVVGGAVVSVPESVLFPTLTRPAAALMIELWSLAIRPLPPPSLIVTLRERVKPVA